MLWIYLLLHGIYSLFGYIFGLLTFDSAEKYWGRWIMIKVVSLEKCTKWDEAIKSGPAYRDSKTLCWCVCVCVSFWQCKCRFWLYHMKKKRFLFLSIQFGMKTWTSPRQPSFCWLSVSVWVLLPRVEIKSGINGMSLAACPPASPSHSTVPNIHTHIRGLMWLHFTLPYFEHTHANTITHTPHWQRFTPSPSQAFGHQSRHPQSPFSKRPDLLNQHMARSIVPQLDLECVCWFGLAGRLR